MISRLAIAFATLAVCFFTGSVQAAPISADEVVALASTGIGDEAVIAKIKSSGARFDLSTQQMLDLKAHGVSGPVIAAMLGGGQPAALSLDSPDPMVPHSAGVYLLVNWADKEKLARMDATVSNQSKTGGILGYALTSGIASMSIKAAIQNSSAKVRAETTTPTFYFFFDESNPDSQRQASAWLAGSASVASSPSEFSLVHLNKKNGRREARVGSLNIGGAKTGVMDKDRIAFSSDLVRAGVYKVTPTEPLSDGEYGFLFSLAGSGSGGALTARVFDFGVDAMGRRAPSHAMRETEPVKSTAAIYTAPVPRPSEAAPARVAAASTDVIGPHLIQCADGTSMYVSGASSRTCKR